MSGLMEVIFQRKNSSPQDKKALSQRKPVPRLSVSLPSLSASLPSLSARFPSKPKEELSYTLYLNGFRLIREPFFIGKLVK